MRKLKPEDQRLWAFVTRTVTPLHGRHPAADEELAAAPPPQKPAKNVVLSSESQSGPNPPRPGAKPVHLPPLHIGRAADVDGATARKLKRGRLPCDAKLDLHGFTLAQAHSALAGFIRAQSARGARHVMVITGKGPRDDGRGEQMDRPKAGRPKEDRPKEDRPRGRIKAELMHWLNAASLRPYILAVTQAGPRQGGAGAVSVLLRRRERLK